MGRPVAADGGLLVARDKNTVSSTKVAKRATKLAMALPGGTRQCLEPGGSYFFSSLPTPLQVNLVV